MDSHPSTALHGTGSGVHIQNLAYYLSITGQHFGFRCFSHNNSPLLFSDGSPGSALSTGRQGLIPADAAVGDVPAPVFTGTGHHGILDLNE